MCGCTRRTIAPRGRRPSRSALAPRAAAKRLLARAAGAIDRDGDPIVYSYAWERSSNGGTTWAPGPAGRVVPALSTVRGQLWRVKARARDWLDASAWVTGEPVAIRNAPPTPPTIVEITPTDPGVGFGLQGGCSGAFDADGDALTSQWHWSRSSNGSDWTVGPTGQVLPSSATQPGEYWRVAVRVSDGQAYSGWAYSEPVLIGPLTAPS